MDLGPIDKRPEALLAMLEKLLAGGHPATFTYFGHSAAILPLDRLRAGQPLFVEGQDAFVTLSIEMYESLMETLDVLSDPGAVASIKEADASTEEDLSLEEMRRLLAERDE
ncbi:type II toxin-antitoxin system Phd/YefM family antitoxin [Micromonospora aurantiaca (nom. illeg.)]|uniref:type II toxin-antitoxin system Phd/YefM family antitoxin n=1 Tax=Micromonospora aurantiaca (nom. illeg.) TaxID=47850 RepID=UPI0033F5AD1E